MGLVKYILRSVQMLSLFLTSIVLFNCLAFASSADGLSQSEAIKFERMENGQYVIEVQINGQGPFKMMIDSAATRTSIFEKTRQKLGIDILQDKETFINGMTSSSFRPIISVGSLHFAGHKFNNHKTIVLEDWVEPENSIDGILGLEVFKDLVLEFTHENNQLKIGSDQISQIQEYRRWTKIDFRPNPYLEESYGLLFTTSIIGDQRILTMIDTGVHFTTINWKSVKNTSLENKKRKLREQWIVKGAIGEFKPRTLIKLDRMRMGGLRFKNHELLVMDFEQLPVNGHGKHPLIIAGVELTGGRDFVLDFKSQHLLIAPKFSLDISGPKMDVNR